MCTHNLFTQHSPMSSVLYITSQKTRQRVVVGWPGHQACTLPGCSRSYRRRAWWWRLHCLSHWGGTRSATHPRIAPAHPERTQAGWIRPHTCNDTVGWVKPHTLERHRQGESNHTLTHLVTIQAGWVRPHTCNDTGKVSQTTHPAHLVTTQAGWVKPHTLERHRQDESNHTPAHLVTTQAGCIKHHTLERNRQGESNPTPTQITTQAGWVNSTPTQTTTT